MNPNSKTMTPFLRWLVFFGVISSYGGGLCLRLVDLHVPGAVRSGEPVQLRCEYDLENAELYSVKWYKNNVEFYRYLPSDVPPGQSYELLGTFVDHSRSDKNNVFLEKTDLNTEGMYGCEVSTEGPGFKTVKGERELRIYVLPEEGPLMEGFQPRYQVGDQVNITCYSRPSKPIATLKWFVNNNAVPAKYETRAGTTRHENGLQSTSTTLHFEMRPEHVSRDVIRFKCTSFVTQAHSRSSEELVIGDKGPPSGRAPQESNSPRILSEKSRYEVGDDVDVNCTSIITEHPVELRWFVNDHEVKGPEAVRFPNVRYADGTQAAVLGLRFRVEARHFSDSDGLRLKCTATQSRVVALSSEETVQGAHQRSSGFRFASDRAATSSLNGGRFARLFCWWWILKTLRSAL
ncbi:cell adhesion molecule 4-like [Dermacentor variabilis]|uniref:cell adhesion molecule 4-like n=1 Tax=Dermacentor variabilis TaxID=34621 RepID=UPI003F5B8761